MLDYEEQIKEAVDQGIILDKRKEMPKGDEEWPKVHLSERMGVCIHQNGSKNFTNPMATARYHTSPNNHITEGRPLPGIIYHICVPDTEDPPWLTSDLINRTYGQNGYDKAGFPGDENTHLMSMLIMGGFKGVGYKGYAERPSTHQMHGAERVIFWLQDVCCFSDAGVFVHADFGKSACPGYFVTEYVENLRANSRQLRSDMEWQQALLIWDENCLPKYGPDGIWGGESKKAISRFQRESCIRVTGMQDPFTELVLMKKYVFA